MPPYVSSQVLGQARPWSRSDGAGRNLVQAVALVALVECFNSLETSTESLSRILLDSFYSRIGIS